MVAHLTCDGCGQERVGNPDISEGHLRAEAARASWHWHVSDGRVTGDYCLPCAPRCPTCLKRHKDPDRWRRHTHDFPEPEPRKVVYCRRCGAYDWRVPCIPPMTRCSDNPAVACPFDCPFKDARICPFPTTGPPREQ